jgi:regulator of sirC expression with transglutaminase-like and TPR domain
MHYSLPAELVESFSIVVSADLGDQDIDLIRGALTIARTEYPELELEEYVSRIDRMAGRTASLRSGADAHSTLAALNRVIFDQANLRGNREDYYDPRNSFLNDVLDRGLGIPITLSIIYMEVASRVGLQLSGVGMPGHFLLKHA